MPGTSTRPPVATATVSPEIDPSWLKWSPASRVVRWLNRLVVHSLCRVTVEGEEHFPRVGPVLVVVNHISALDVPIYFAVLPRRVVVFVGHNWARVPGLNRYLKWAINAVWLNREGVDRNALRQATTALKAGCCFVLAPEGTISRTGGLIPGKTGAAFLAKRACPRIAPVVTFGPEQAVHYWRRLRRVPVTVRYGPTYELRSGEPGAETLEACTETIMLSLAHLLPSAYRGVYADRCEPSGDAESGPAETRTDEARREIYGDSEP